MFYKLSWITLTLLAFNCNSEVFNYKAVESLSVANYQITTNSSAAAPTVVFTPTDASIRDFTLSLIDTATTVVAISGNTIVPRAAGSAQLKITSLDGGATSTFTVTVVDSTSTSAPTLTQKLRGIWLVGGLDTSISTPVGPVDMYDPVTSTWYPAVTTLPTPVSFMAAASIGNKIYVIGGFDAAGAVQTLNQEYDISTDTWTNRAAMPAARANIYGSMINGKIVVLGGSTTAASAAFTTSTSTYEYTPGAPGSWTSRVNFGATSTHRGHVAVGGVLYNMGGRTSATASATTHDGIAWSANAVTGGTEVVLSAGRSGYSLVAHTAQSTGTRIFILGGISTPHTGCSGNFILAGTCTAFTALNTVQSLAAPFTSPSTWGTTTNLPATRAFGSAAVYGDTIYYFGGNVAATVGAGETTAYSIDAISLASWTTLTAMPRARWGHEALTINP
jgi:hypothetical protein